MQENSQHRALPIAITSGKGGVGKTNITTNLGIALAGTGKQVCIIDGDTSLANINILLDITPRYTLDSLLRGERSLQEILLTGPQGLRIVPSATGITDYLNMTTAQQQTLMAAMEQLEQEYDYILIDTAAGISDSVINFIQLAQYAVVVVSPEPTSLTDAFSLLKVLQQKRYEQPIYVLVNLAESYNHSMEVFKRFAGAAAKYLNLKVRYLGYLPIDSAVRTAVAKQRPVIVGDPESPAGRCINLLANILVKHFAGQQASARSISQLWRQQLAKIDAETQAETPLTAAPAAASEPAPLIPADSPADPQPVAVTPSAPLAAVETAAVEPTVAETSAVETTTAETTTAETSAAKTTAIETPVQTAAVESAPAEGAGFETAAGNTGPADAYELIVQALDDGRLDQAQVEELLTLLVKYHLTEFGTLPQQAIDLVLQAHAQAQLEPGALRSLYQELQDTLAEQNRSATAASNTELSSLEAQIDALTEAAGRTKERMNGLAARLQQKYRELYNADIALASDRLAARRGRGLYADGVAAVASQQDREGLRDSLRYAALVDSLDQPKGNRASPRG